MLIDLEKNFSEGSDGVKKVAKSWNSVARGFDLAGQKRKSDGPAPQAWPKAYTHEVTGRRQRSRSSKGLHFAAAELTCEPHTTPDQRF